MAANTVSPSNGCGPEPIGEHIDGLERALAAHDRDLIELREAVRRLTSQKETQEKQASRDGSGALAWPRRTSRRSLLRGAGAWIAAIAAAGAATGSPSRSAEATDGNAIVAGANNTTLATGVSGAIRIRGHETRLVGPARARPCFT
jgi:hypothetical protein